MDAFFFFLLDVVPWSLRLYFAAFADCTAARGEDVENGRAKGGGAIVRAERKSVVGEAFVRHEGQYRVAAMVVGCVYCGRSPAPGVRYGRLQCRSRGVGDGGEWPKRPMPLL